MCISAFLEVYFQGILLEERLLGQKLSAYVVLLDIVVSLHDHCRSFLFQQQYLRTFVSPRLANRMHSPYVSIFASLIGWKWYLNAILRCISLITSKLEYFCIFLMSPPFYFGRVYVCTFFCVCMYVCV